MDGDTVSSSFYRKLSDREVQEGWMSSETPMHAAYVDSKIDFTQNHPKNRIPLEVFLVAKEMLWSAGRISVDGRIITMPDIEIYADDPHSLAVSWAIKQRELEIRIKLESNPTARTSRVVKRFVLWGPELFLHAILTRFGPRREIDNEDEALELIKWVHCESIYDPWFVKPSIDRK